MDCTVISYSAENVTEHEDVDIADTARIKDSVVWIDLKNPGKKELKELEKTYALHHLAIEDCTEMQRPKIETYEDHFFVVLRHIEYESKVKTKQIGIFVGKNYLISVHKEELDILDEIRKSIKEGIQNVNKYGPDYLLYKITDSIVDNYFVILDTIEKEVVKKHERSILKKVFKTKKDLLLVRKSLWPMREVLHTIQSGTVKEVSARNIRYFRDVYDHMIDVIDLIETYRELVTASLETHLSSVSNSLNEVMKVLTVISSLVLFPTLVASIYGMNFKVMPELEWAHGYPFALSIMLASMIIMYVYFRKRRWV